GSLGFRGVLDFDAQQGTTGRVERRLLQSRRQHFAEPFEAVDSETLAIDASQQAIALAIVERPVDVLADLDLIKRWLRDVHVAEANQLGQLAIEEGEQERADVMPVGVGIHQQADLPIAQLGGVEVFTRAAAQGRHEVAQLLVRQHLAGRRLLGVEHLAAQRQDGLELAVATLLGGATSGIALDDEELALVRICRAAIGELPRQVEAMRSRRLALHTFSSGPRRGARPRRQDHAVGDGLGLRGIPEQIVFQSAANRAVDRRADLGVVEPILGLSLKLRLPQVHTEDGHQSFSDVFRGNGESFWNEVLYAKVIAHRLGEPVLEAVLVGPAGRRGDAVDERQDAFVGRLGPCERALQHEALAALRILALGVEGLGDLLLAAIADELVDILGYAALVPKRFAVLVDLVLKDQREAAMEV